MSKVAIIGAGYVGLTTAVCFAHLGHEVICADIDPERVDRLQRGEVPIVEAGLEAMMAEGLRNGRLRFVLGAEVAAEGCEFVYLCVPTPQGEDGSADLSYIVTAATSIAPVLSSESIVINKSTVPVGSTKVVEKALGRSDVSVVSNPEFLREGSAIHDFLHPDRIVIGSDDQAAAIRVATLYLGVPAPLIVTNPASAETIKYAANAFLATKISFVNAVAAVCEAVGADVNDVVLGIGYDKRIGQEFLKPGPGWGGSCFPKDTRAMVHIAETAGYDFQLLRGVISVNDQQRERVVSKIIDAAGGSLQGRARCDVGAHVQGPHGRSARIAVVGGRATPRRGGGGRAGLRPDRARRRSRASRSPTTPTTFAKGPTFSPCSPSGTSSAGSMPTRSVRR